MTVARRTPLARLIGVVTALATVAALLVVPVSAGAEPVDDRVADVRVDPVLLDALMVGPDGSSDASATAIVTTHDRSGMDAVEAAGVTGVRLRTLPMILVQDLTAGELAALRALPEVRGVWGRYEYPQQMQESVWVTQARTVWEDRGYTGAGVELALVYEGDGETEPHWIPVGTPQPHYATDGHPGGDTRLVEQVGCTALGTFDLPELGGDTTFEVPEGAGDLAVTVDWGDHHPDANLYLQLFRPGHDPMAHEDDPGPTRTFPVAESAGLLDFDEIFVIPVVGGLGTPATSRTVTFVQPEDGAWSLRVLHRTGGTAQPCGDHDNTEGTQQDLPGFRYGVEVHATGIVDQPTTEFSADRIDDDWVQLEGTAQYPDQLEGVTTWQAPASHVEPDEIVIAETLYLDGEPVGDTVESEGTFGPDEPGHPAPITQTAETPVANPETP